MLFKGGQLEVTCPLKKVRFKSRVLELIRKARTMKKSRFSEEQVVNILREGRGIKPRELCAKHNISEPTYYAWKKKYGEMDVSEVRQLRAISDEVSRLKRIIADQAVQIDILKEVNSKKW
jgi:putative transposase